MLKLEQVQKRRNRFLLDNISIELPEGYIMGLIGENGAGKTTLFQILAGLLSADKGEIRLDGISLAEDEAAVKQEIGAVLHGDMFDVRDTLLRNGNRYGRFYRRYEESSLKERMAEFGLDGRKKYGRLSKGEKLKFAMAFALSHKPKLLLLDEPAANFDKEFRTLFVKVLRDYVADGENTVILSTHLTSDIDMLADYLLFLKGGRQLLYGDIESVRARYRIAAGEEYKLKLLKDRIIHMESGEFGSRALVYNSGKPFDSALKVWEPSIEELMYFMEKCPERAQEKGERL